MEMDKENKEEKKTQSQGDASESQDIEMQELRKNALRGVLLGERFLALDDAKNDEEIASAAGAMECATKLATYKQGGAKALDEEDDQDEAIDGIIGQLKNKGTRQAGKAALGEFLIANQKLDTKQVPVDAVQKIATYLEMTPQENTQPVQELLKSALTFSLEVFNAKLHDTALPAATDGLAGVNDANTARRGFVAAADNKPALKAYVINLLNKYKATGVPEEVFPVICEKLLDYANVDASTLWE